MRPEQSQKSSSDSPLFKADSATLTFSATDGGKIRVLYGGWDDAKVGAFLIGLAVADMLVARDASASVCYGRMEHA
jgi:hypothetical protein